MLNINRSNFQGHPFHLVSPSPWPICTCISLFNFTTSLVSTIHGFSDSIYWMICGLVLLISTMFFWFRDVISEGTYLGNHTLAVQLGLNMGVALFIVSEALFFLAIFWAYFHSALCQFTINNYIYTPGELLNIASIFKITNPLQKQSLYNSFDSEKFYNINKQDGNSVSSDSSEYTKNTEVCYDYASKNYSNKNAICDQSILESTNNMEIKRQSMFDGLYNFLSNPNTNMEANNCLNNITQEKISTLDMWHNFIGQPAYTYQIPLWLIELLSLYVFMIKFTGFGCLYPMIKFLFTTYTYSSIEKDKPTRYNSHKRKEPVKSKLKKSKPVIGKSIKNKVTIRSRKINIGKRYKKAKNELTNRRIRANLKLHPKRLKLILQEILTIENHKQNQVETKRILKSIVKQAAEKAQIIESLKNKTFANLVLMKDAYEVLLHIAMSKLNLSWVEREIYITIYRSTTSKNNRHLINATVTSLNQINSNNSGINYVVTTKKGSDKELKVRTANELLKLMGKMDPFILYNIAIQNNIDKILKNFEDASEFDDNLHVYFLNYTNKYESIERIYKRVIKEIFMLKIRNGLLHIKDEELENIVTATFSRVAKNISLKKNLYSCVIGALKQVRTFVYWTPNTVSVLNELTPSGMPIISKPYNNNYSTIRLQHVYSTGNTPASSSANDKVYYYDSLGLGPLPYYGPYENSVEILVRALKSSYPHENLDDLLYKHGLTWLVKHIINYDAINYEYLLLHGCYPILEAHNVNPITIDGNPIGMYIGPPYNRCAHFTSIPEHVAIAYGYNTKISIADGYLHKTLYKNSYVYVKQETINELTRGESDYDIAWDRIMGKSKEWLMYHEKHLTHQHIKSLIMNNDLFDKDYANR